MSTQKEHRAVEVKCPDCGATHVRPRYVDPDDPPETITGKCYAPHPERGADFEGCGEEVDLKVVECREPQTDGGAVTQYTGATIPIRDGEDIAILLNGRRTNEVDAGGVADGYVRATAELDGRRVNIFISYDTSGAVGAVLEWPEEDGDADLTLDYEGTDDAAALCRFISPVPNIDAKVSLTPVDAIEGGDDA